MSPKKPISSEAQAARSHARPARPFVYRPAPGWAGPSFSEAASANASSATSGAVSAAVPGVEADPPLVMASQEDDLHTIEKRAWDAGFREGSEQARAENEAATKQQKEAVASALRDFAREQNEYFHQVEGEVVALALAIVRKILRRESQLDPLLLSGLVRVALEKIAVSRNVRLRVHPSQIQPWQSFFKNEGLLPVTPELQGDGSLEQDQCVIETEHGVTDLNLETQLKEIEQGLFDLLAQRPAPK